MSYLGLSECFWLFTSNTGRVYGVPIAQAHSYGKAYEIAFNEFYG